MSSHEKDTLNNHKSHTDTEMILKILAEIREEIRPTNDLDRDIVNINQMQQPFYYTPILSNNTKPSGNNNISPQNTMPYESETALETYYRVDRSHTDSEHLNTVTCDSNLAYPTTLTASTLSQPQTIAPTKQIDREIKYESQLDKEIMPIDTTTSFVCSRYKNQTSEQNEKSSKQKNMTPPPTSTSSHGMPNIATQTANNDIEQEPVVIPIHTVLKKHHKKSKRTLRSNKATQRTTQQQSKKHSQLHQQQMNSDQPIVVAYPSLKSVELATTKWPPSLYYGSNETILKISDWCSNISLMLGWGMLSCGLLLYLRSCFGHFNAWGNYGLPILTSGMVFLILGTVITMLSRQLRQVLEIQYTSLHCKTKLNPEIASKSSKTATLASASTPSHNSDLFKKMISQPESAKQTDDDQFYEKLLTLRDEIEELLEESKPTLQQ